MREMSIRRKLVLFFSIMILSILSLFIYILGSAFNYLNIYEDDLIKTSLVQHLSSVIKDNSMTFDNVIKSYTKENKLKFEKSIKEVWDSWVKVKNRANTSQDAFFQIEAIRYGMLTYIESAKTSIESMNKDHDKFSEHSLKARRVEDYISNYLNILIKIRLDESSILHENQKEEVARVRIISFISIAVIGIICLIFSNFFTITLTKPILNLANNARLMAEGNLDVQMIETNSNDEIGVLTNSFNDMSKNINIMVESLKDKVKIEKQHHEDELKLIDMGKTLKEAQFLSLQSQINPHFLFNTLNTISRTSMFEQAPKTIRLIECLSNIFRYNLNNQEKSVTLEEELDILEEYMFIQKTRYGERINYKVEYNTDISNVRIPIFTLQPLVENSVKYGIEPKEDGGEIYITVNKSFSYIIIKITDTGIGFDTKSSFKNKSDSTNIGIKNVKKRLALKFDGNETFNIESKIDYGTTVTIKIPEETIV